MTGTPTGTLVVVGTEGRTETFSWNGEVADREAARTAFDEAKSQGGILATVVEEPGQAVHVTSFDEIEEIERVRGTVTARVSRQVVGG